MSSLPNQKEDHWVICKLLFLTNSETSVGVDDSGDGEIEGACSGAEFVLGLKALTWALVGWTDRRSVALKEQVQCLVFGVDGVRSVCVHKVLTRISHTNTLCWSI